MPGRLLSLWAWTKRRAMTILLALSVAANVYQLLGAPPWPTSPDVHPTPSSSPSPFTFPFVVHNTSALFDMKNVRIGCFIEEALYDNDAGLRNVRFIAGMESPFEIPAGTPINHFCDYRRVIGAEAKLTYIRAHLEFNYTFWFGRNWSRHFLTIPFTWSATTPQWIEGPSRGMRWFP